MVIAIAVAYALWAGVAALHQQPLVGTVSRYQVVSDTSVDYGLIVTGPAGVTVHCSVVARGDDYAIVGQDERTLTLDSTGEAHDSGSDHDAAARRQRRSRSLRAGLTTPPAYRARSGLVGRLPR